MTNNKIYGIDLHKTITASMVRDALVECFFEAHCVDAGLGTDDPSTNKEYILALIKKAFSNSSEDFNQPTKASLCNVINKLKDFSKNFRDQSLIEKHASQMMELVDKITE